MSLATADIIGAVETHAAQSGLFEQVNNHQPKNPPGHGLSCAIVADRLSPIRRSGLDVLSGRLVLSVQIVTPMVSEPADDIDVHVLGAADALMAAYTADFTLGGLLRHVDVLGAEGIPLDCTFGYIRVDDVDYRIATITLPLIINDLWTEEA